MRLAYVGHSAIPSRSANSVNIMKMCAAFKHNGHEITLFRPARGGGEQGVADIFAFYGLHEPFEVVVLPWLPVSGRSYLYALQAVLTARLARHDLVYTRFMAVGVLAAALGMAVVFESHAPPGARGSIGRRVFQWMARRRSLRRIVVITGALGEELVAGAPEIAEKLAVVADGADPIPPQAGVAELGGRSGVLRVGYVGQLYDGKGMELIVQLAREAPWADFHVVGGAVRDIERWTDATAGLENLLLHGFVPHGSVCEYLQAFDVLVAPYQKNVAVFGGSGDVARWMSPLKLFEYMAAGKAIVCSDLPVLREVLEHEVTALLCDPGDIATWVATLARLRDDHSLRAQLGRRALSRFQSRHTWAARAAETLRGLDHG